MGAALIVLLVGLGALATGVLIGRYYVPDDRMLKRSARHSRAYMRALIHHIARDHDTVIAELRKVVEENVEDSEPYFALAALFRARGEHERSIRVHQALAVREGATHKLKMRALYELGLDFRAAGMPRRAARALEDVLTSDPRHEGALRALCGMYEEQGRFAEAAGAWTRLSKLRGEVPPRRQHHLLCAAAQRAVADGDLDSAKRLLKDARSSAPDGKETAHFFAAAAELAAARKNPKAARERLRQALTAAPELARYLVPGLTEAERQLVAGDAAPQAASTSGDDLDEDATLSIVPAGVLDPIAATSAARAAAATLAELADTTRSPHLAVAAAEALGPLDPTAALERFRRVAADSPEHLPARIAAARLALAAADPVVITAELTALAGDGGALSWADGASWRCPHCSHRAGGFTWRCPGCRRWGAARPEVGRERVIPVVRSPRERRAEPRAARDGDALEGAHLAMPQRADASGVDVVGRGAADPDGRTLLGDSAAAALPSAELDHGLSSAELSARSARRSVLGRVGGWISGAWSGMRRKQA